MTLSYLVSTAGHSRAYNETYPHNIRSIVQLIEEGAGEFEDEPVVGFPVLKESKWTCKRYSFRQLLRLSNGLIRDLRTIGIRPSPDRNPIVGLLCPSNVDFLIAWIALMRLGYGVLLVAPQCSASAIGSLLRTTECVRLLYDPRYKSLAMEVQNSVCDVLELPIDSTGEDSVEGIAATRAECVSHVFHSSGTSGTPKPIPHTHLGSTSILPRRALPRYIHGGSDLNEPVAESASFTTTPLFHGGVSDLLRAWMARSMLYLYPTSEVPVTTQHLCNAMAACNANHSSPELTPRHREERNGRYKVDAFLSVPYILTTLCDDPEGVKLLRSMSLVSTGGAPLAKEIGDKMVEEKIRLVSRLGSSECGFLLSSVRAFDTEEDWDWLRNDSSYSSALSFEPLADRDGLYELVVGTEWSSKTKANREDGTYATGDLYRLHPQKANVWQYVGRGDDVIVMSNGEKVSPGFMEECIRKCSVVKEALVVGSDQSSLGLLVFSDSPRGEVIEEINPYLDDANKTQPTFAEIYPEMCLVLDGDAYERIPKASKGTVQRGLANEVFAGEIASLWTENRASLPTKTREEIEAFLTATVAEALGQLLPQVGMASIDLFSAGVDSLKATMIRSKIVKSVNTGDRSVPLNIVFDRSTISSLASYLFDLQQGTAADIDSNQADFDLMRDWTEKYGSFHRAPETNGSSNGHQAGPLRVLLLTGVTGSLGSELLRLVVESRAPDYDKVICLVRAKDDMEARKRLERVMAFRGISRRIQLEARAADLPLGTLGLDDDLYDSLLASELTVLHAAWRVHFASGLRSFEDSIKGLRNLLDLVNAAQGPRGKMIFCSSLASILNTSPGATVKELPSSDPQTATSVGYSRSKWVAEQVCLCAREIGIDVQIMRLGQLCGSSLTGQWNETEGWPLLIRTAQTTGTLPLLKESIPWLPVDVSAQAILEIMSSKCETPIYHLVHPEPTTWSIVLEGVESSSLKFDPVTPQEWVKRVENTSEDVVENPSRKMLFLWQQAYGKGTTESNSPIIDTTRAQEGSATLAGLEPLKPEHFAKSIAAWRRSGFMS